MATVESGTVPALAALRVIATAIFVIALPLLLVTSGVRWVALSESFYQREFAKYRIGQTTGFSDAELGSVAQAFHDYFQSEPGPMEVTIQRPDGPTALFNEREIAHMTDVQALMHRIFGIWTIAIAALLISGLVIVLADPPTGAPALARAAAIGSGLAVLLVGALGAASLFDFSELFLRFHLLSFSNDLWLLDPRRDRLIQLFPQGFFLDAALFIAIETVAVGLVVLAASGAALRALK
jgi:integral membrane protein (TIGR01906 family)